MDISWQLDVGDEKADSRHYHWSRLCLWLYFPKQNIARLALVHTLLPAFEKPQRSVIMSWIYTWLKMPRDEGEFDMKAMELPHHLAKASLLVGAAIDDLTHEEI